MKRARALFFAVAPLLLLAACTADSGTSPTPAIHVTGTDRTLRVPESVDISGRSATDLAAISLTAGVGTVEFQGQPAAAFYSVAAGAPGVDATVVYEVIAAQTDRLIWAFAYCAGTALYALYYETTDGVVSKQPSPATGTCSVAAGPTTEAVALPALDLSTIARVRGFGIAGSGIELDESGAGTIMLGAVQWPFYAFNAVDCTSCGAPGWYELHTIMWFEPARAACLGILYLTNDNHTSEETSVGLSYTRCLPDLSDLTGGFSMQYAASWTHR
jgi:hypothetical protein